MHSVDDLVVCLGDFIEHLSGILLDLMVFMVVWCSSDDFRRKNFARTLSGERVMCVKYVV